MKPGDWVRTTEPEMGTAQGPRNTPGDGQPREIPAGAVCEVFAVEPALNWATIHYELDYGGHRDPYRIEAVVEYERLVAVPRPEPTGFVVPPPPPDVMDGATAEAWRDWLPEILENGLSQEYYDAMPAEIRSNLDPRLTSHLRASPRMDAPSDVHPEQTSLTSENDVDGRKAGE